MPRDGESTIDEIERTIRLIYQAIKDGNLEYAQQLEETIYSEQYRRVRVTPDMERRLNRVIMARVDVTTAVERALLGRKVVGAKP